MTPLNTIIEEENTPDTEWEKDFDEKFGWLKRSKVTGAQLYDQMMLKHFITSLLSSRDTYLKERVRERILSNAYPIGMKNPIEVVDVKDIISETQ